MKQIIDEIANFWYKNPAAETNKIRNTEAFLRCELPADYKTFLLWSNGGEGGYKDSYLSLWEIENILSLNKEYEIDKCLPNILGIGTDGGSQCYGFDYRQSAHKPPFVKFPLGDLDFSSVVLIGPTFNEGLKSVFHLE